MKDLKILVLMMMALFLCNVTAIAQEEEEKEEEVEEVVEEIVAAGIKTFNGTFDGFEDDVYSFNYKNEDDEDDSMFFNVIAPEILTMYDLKGKKFVGKKFEITFAFEYENEVDEDGDKQEFVKRTITKLKLIN
ncbi:hypothetical protein [uncultured Aquimarina sp.]|uniref:hypothetical protein n=1 Tax=uncultured Aquimarina sp. TaxID=575652 RepID=UPI0026148C48|nr:hypothetical protein [uncultured Aquimarina sp.]